MKPNNKFRAFVASAVALVLMGSTISLVSPAQASNVVSFRTSADVVPGESGVVAVKIPAHQKGAYPLKGLKAASIVYVEPVERGFTRHIAIYGTDKVPTTVGPVRSLRETDFAILDQFGIARVYASGRSLERKIMLDLLSSTKHVLRINSFNNLPEMFSPKGCVDPFCDFLRGTKIPGRNTGLSASTTTILKEAGLVKGTIPAKVKKTGKSISTLTIQYKKTPFSQLIPRTITWSAKKKMWIYAASGRNATIDMVNGKSVKGVTASATAVIQFTSAKNAGNAFTCRAMPLGGPDSVPYTNSVGSGKGLLLRDGKMYNITWSRKTSAATTSYKFANGSKVKVAGQPWVYLVPTNLTKTTVKYTSGRKATILPKASTPRWSFSTSVLKERKLCEAPSRITVSKVSTTKSVVKVKSNFNSLKLTAVKGIKVKVRISGKGYKYYRTDKYGAVTVKYPLKKILSVTIAKQTVSGQHYAAKAWTKK